MEKEVAVEVEKVDKEVGEEVEKEVAVTSAGKSNYPKILTLQTTPDKI